MWVVLLGVRRLARSLRHHSTRIVVVVGARVGLASVDTGCVCVSTIADEWSASTVPFNLLHVRTPCRSTPTPDTHTVEITRMVLTRVVPRCAANVGLENNVGAHRPDSGLLSYLCRLDVASDGVRFTGVFPKLPPIAHTTSATDTFSRPHSLRANDATISKGTILRVSAGHKQQCNTWLATVRSKPRP